MQTRFNSTMAELLINSTVLLTELDHYKYIWASIFSKQYTSDK